MQENLLKISFKKIVLIVLLVIGIYFLLPKLVGLEQALVLLRQANPGFLILAVIAEILSYVCAAFLLGVIFSRIGHLIDFYTRLKLSSMAAFTIHFVPLGVAGEAAFEYSFLKKLKIDSGSIILMWILRWIFNYTGFFLLFLVSLVLVPTYPKLAFSSRIISPIIFILVASSIIYIIYLYRNKDKFWIVWSRLFNFFSRLLIKFKKNPFTEEKRKEIFEDIYQGIALFSRKKRTSVLAVLYGALYWLGDMTCLYFVFHSFGYPIQWGVLIFGYSIATILGIMSAIPGGMGVTEGTMALLFTGMGVPSTVAITTVLLFRLFSFWMWIPAGFLSYLSLRKVGENT